MRSPLGVAREHPATERLVARYKEMQVELIRLAYTLRFIQRLGGSSPTGGLSRESKNWESIPLISVKADPPWQAAIEALASDAGAPLPD